MQLIARKDSANPTHAHLGFIRPAYRLVDGKWQPTLASQFPNPGKVFVTAEYNEIDSIYQPDELFFADCAVNTQNYTAANPFSCQYITTYAQTRQPEPHELCPVLPRTFDPDQRVLLHVAYEAPLTYVFLRTGTGSGVVGPFQAVPHRDLPSERKEFRLVAVPAAELDQHADYDGCVYCFRHVTDYAAVLLAVDGAEYIRDVRDLLDSPAAREPIYFGDTDDLLRWARRVVRPPERREFWERATQAFNGIPAPGDPLERQRLLRLRELLTESQQWFNERLPEFIGQFLSEHPLGQQALTEYLRANEGRLFRRDEDAKPAAVPKAHPSPTGSDTVEAYLSQVSDYLAECGRPLERADLTHYLVTLHQNLLTVVAGLPGVGKTSLITLLARASGLTGRLLTIPVARGWTSSRDLVGYHNPLSGQFQPARTGLYEVLRQISEETRQRAEQVWWVLLDEANLSPLEHYWSDFVRFTDPESDRTLRLGGPDETLALGSGLRFVATINYDHTTEPLSPRIIDRAAVIRLRPSGGPAGGRAALPPPPAGLPPLSVGGREAWFGHPAEARPLLSDEEILLNQLRQVMEDDRPELGLPLLLSPRKQRAIVEHTAALRRLLGNETAHPLLALDYAVGVHLLPLLSGRGEGFGKRLGELHERTVRTLPQSAQLLQRLIRLGQQQYHQYNFFA
jgi:hypothetical protein